MKYANNIEILLDGVDREATGQVRCIAAHIDGFNWDRSVAHLYAKLNIRLAVGAVGSLGGLSKSVSSEKCYFQIKFLLPIKQVDICG